MRKIRHQPGHGWEVFHSWCAPRLRVVTKLAEFCRRFVASKMQDSRDGELPMINATPPVHEQLTDLATRARAEFREMPGMCLTTAQAARLAAMVPSPRRYGPGQTTAYLQRRTEIILGRMPGARVP